MKGTADATAPKVDEDDDDLDDLIGDSLAGAQSAAKDEAKPETAAEAASHAADAVKELQEGPTLPAEDGFQNLVKLFQGDDLQKAMAEALKDTAGAAGSGEGGDQPNEDFLQNFLKSFEAAVGNDEGFANSLGSLMTSMLSNDLICEPLKQIAEKLEPWLKEQKDLSPEDKARYEQQLDTYKKIIDIYEKNSDPLPDGAREEVQKLLSELHTMGQPPDEVMKAIQPKEAEGGDTENFEEFMKSMGLADGLSGQEQELLKKLSEDPEELTKAMKEMAESLGKEGGGEECKQQ
jgi:peroxin-19